MAHMGTPNGMTQVAHPEVERHIRQNNERLRCIQRHLQSPGAFEKAAKELLEWCSDPRAFQKAFEDSLMNCLTVISEVASKPGFNLSLGYRLLAVCSANREKFSPKSSNHLHAWCEDLGKLLLLQHHSNNRPNEGMRPVVPSPSPNSHTPLDPAYLPNGPMGSRMGRYPPEGHAWNHNVHDPNHRNIPGSMHQRPALSVTTTVWGVSDATQSPAIRGQGHPPMNQYSMGPNPSPHPRPQGVGYHMNIYNRKAGQFPNNGPYPRNDYVSSGHRGVPGPGYPPNNAPHSVHNMRSDANEYPPPAAAAAAAAVAAAAATATATATAMVVNDQQQQQQQNEMYGQMGQHGSGMIHPMDGHSVPPGPVPRDPNIPMDGMGTAAARGSMRHGMYGQYGPVNKNMGPNMGPTPHHSNSAAAPPPNHGMGGYNSMNPQYRPAYRSNSNSYCPTSPYDAPPTNQFKPPSMSGHPPQPTPNGFTPRVPTPGPVLTATPGPDMYPSVSSAGNASQYYNSQPNLAANVPPHPTNGPMGFNSPRPSFYGPMSRGMPQHQPPDPMPGNPTPPITPGSAHNVPPFPGPDVKPPMPIDVKPIIPNHGSMPPLDPPTPSPIIQQQSNNNSNEMRMTFPVRDGVVLEPFRLEHNRSLSTRAFQLRPTAYETLMWRPDLELEFKCYHHDDKMQHTNWPHSVQVTVNGSKMQISRNPCKPLYLRDVCRDGRNTIDIEVSTCCCSHYFVLQLVHRPNVRSVLMGLLTKRMLPAANSVTKIKRLFQHRLVNGVPRSLVGSPVENGVSGDDENSTIVSLRCPITFRRINLPARGSECKHIACFDLEAYLQLNSDKRTWSCPVCRKTALLEGLEVDQYIWGILRQSHPEDLEVIIDSRCNWKPIVMKGYGGDDEGPAKKRMKSTGMSPATMFNRLPSPGSYVPQMTPLPPTRLTMTPDMSGSGVGPSPGGCGYHNNSNGMSRSLTQTPGPPVNGPIGTMGMGRPTGPHITPKNMPSMNSVAQNAMIHRANPLQLDNIAADDMVMIKKTLNPARVPDPNAGTNPPTPNIPLGNHPPPPHQMLRQGSSNGQCIQSPVSLPQQQHADQRIRNNTTPSNPNPVTPGGNPRTPNMDILSPQVPVTNSNNSVQNFPPSRPNNAIASTPCNTNPSSDLNFDPDMVISGNGIGENDDKIPSLDILPGNTDPLELIDYLGTNGDDIISMFDNAN